MRLIYSRGFPYGAPLVMLRGGATKDPVVKQAIRDLGFSWDGTTHSWRSYGYAEQAAEWLAALAALGCEVLAKSDLDDDLVIDGYEARA